MWLNTHKAGPGFPSLSSLEEGVTKSTSFKGGAY